MGYLNQSHRIQAYANGISDTSRVPSVLRMLYATSAANTQIDLSNITFLKSQGKKRQLQLNYWPLLCDIEGECGQGLCVDGETVEPREQVFEITQCTATKKFKFKLSDFRLLDNDAWDVTTVASLIVEKAMPEARKLLAKEMLTYLLTKVGTHTDGSLSKQVQILNPLTGAVQPSGMLDIVRMYDDASQGTPYLLGGGKEVYDLLKMKGSAGMNDAGVNTGADFLPNTYYDEMMLGVILNDLAAGNHILGIDPRIFKIVSYSENSGIFRTDLDDIGDVYSLFKGNQGHDFLLGTYTDPKTGIIWDLYVNFEKCTQDWDFHLEHKWDIITLPVECQTPGYNGITRWRTCPEVTAPCPTGDSPVSTNPGQEYSATPNLSLIPTISQSNIGGVVNVQETAVAINTIDDLVAYMNSNFTTPIFSKDGSTIVYSGFVDYTVTFNNGDYTLNFS